MANRRKTAIPTPRQSHYDLQTPQNCRVRASRWEPDKRPARESALATNEASGSLVPEGLYAFVRILGV